jgi:ABC-2 type transport system ATP-binding protein
MGQSLVSEMTNRPERSQPMDAVPLVVEHLSKSFGGGRTLWGRERTSARAVDDVSCRIERNEIYGVLGANGSGKSTLVRMISTLLTPDAGSIRVFGLDVQRDELAVRRLMNRVSPDPSFFRNMSALENLLFFGRIYGLGSAEIKQRSQEILDRLGIGDRIREPLLHFSRGQQQKVAVARAFLTSPVLMLLDEPTTGLDPASKREVQQFVLQVRDEHDATILLTTHDMDEAERLCDRISFLANGRIVAEGTPLELRARAARGRPIDDVSMEDVFLELTGKAIEEDEEVLVHG